MHFFGWLFKNPIIALIMATVLLAVFNWDNLDQWLGKNKKHDAVVSEVIHGDDPVAGTVTGTVTEVSATEAVTVSDSAADSFSAESVAVEGIASVNADASTQAIESTAVVVTATETKAREGIFSRLFKRKETLDASHDATAATMGAVDQAANSAVTTSVADGVSTMAGRTQDVVSEAVMSATSAADMSQQAVEAAIEQVTIVTQEVQADTTEVVIDTMPDSTAEVLAEEDKPSLFKKLFPGKNGSEKGAEAIAEVVTETAAVDIQPAPVPPVTSSITGEVSTAAVVDEAEETVAKKSLFEKIFPPNGSVETSVEAITETAETTASAASNAYTSQYQDSLDSARNAYWAGDLASADAIYQNLMHSDPANPDVFGEYGNLLYQSGRIPDAVRAYEKSARLLINANRIEEAKPLILFIGDFDRETAQALVKRLNDQMNAKG